MVWQPIETAPSDRTLMLTDGELFGFRDVSYHADGSIVTCPASAAFDGSEAWLEPSRYEALPKWFYPTHWDLMPLPPSASEE